MVRQPSVGVHLVAVAVRSPLAGAERAESGAEQAEYRCRLAVLRGTVEIADPACPDAGSLGGVTESDAGAGLFDNCTWG